MGPLYKLSLEAGARSRDADLDVFNESVGHTSPTEEDPPIYGMSQGLMTVEWIKEIVSKYGVPPKFVYKLLGGSECISYLGPIEVAIY